MHVYHLSVAGIKIRFEVDRPLLENKEFFSFITETSEPDLYVVVRQTKDLPRLPVEPVYADGFCAITKNHDGNLQKYFWDKSQGTYVITTYSSNRKNITIDYPESYALVEMDLQNCFYYLGFEESLLYSEKLCLHASCVDTKYGGILFSGKSGIGKSTQADLWCKFRNARQINGDRPIISKEGQTWFAWGSPYAGSSKCYVNGCAEISLIVLLKQSRICSLRRLSLPEAFRGVWAGLTVHSWDADFVEKASMLTSDLINSIPVYEFHCTPNEEAVKFMEEMLRKENNI